MNEQLQAKLVEILAGIQSATKAAGDFALEQLPEIARQYVLYGRIKTLAVSMFLALFAACLFALARWAYKNPWNTSTWSFEKDKLRSDSNTALIWAPSLLASMLLAIAAFSFDWLVWVAPKVWLLKELASLVK